MTRQELYDDYVAQCINGLDDIDDPPCRYIALEYSDDYLVWCATFDTAKDALNYLNTSDTTRTSEDIIDLDNEESLPLMLKFAYGKDETK